VGGSEKKSTLPNPRFSSSGVFAGQKGGPMVAIVPLIGEVLGIESQPIEYSSSGGKHGVPIDSGVEIDAEDFIPAGMVAPTQLVGVFHTPLTPR